ncbi:MAG TPA: hypothetical protein PKE15_00090 [Ottowia sp.]|nr:hypothetical protein [Ottowia sp.]
MSSPRLPLYHLRRSLRQQAQETRRLQREAAAVQAAELAASMDAFAEDMAAAHRRFVQQQAADQQRLITEAEGPPEVLFAMRKQLH